MIASLLLAALQTADVAGHPYEPLATREATLERMLDRLVPEDAQWGEWWVIAPFPFDEETGMDAIDPPEQELERHAFGGPGPDLTATYPGKNGHVARWESLGDATNRRVELRRFDDPELNDWATAYLYTTATTDEAKDVVLPFGSDDGVRVWLNGEVCFEADWMRGMTAGGDRIPLALEAGTNHILMEVYQGVGGWEFQADTRRELPAQYDAQLFYLLDRDFPPSTEREYYGVMSYPVPEEIALEVGGIAFLADGRPAVSTRRGEVFVIENAYDEPPVHARFDRFASGLHEALGLAVRTDAEGEALYSVQRGELTRLLDTDGDGAADWYHTFSDGWGVSGNYHEFSFGPKLDRDGNAWVTLNVGFCGSLGKSLVPWRGWALKVTPAGEVIPVCDGLRSPNGIGMFTDGEMFYVDNQGDYVATNRLSHLKEGSWHGHPASLRWREGLSADERPPRQPPAVWFPYGKMGQSVADLALDDTGGRFGPFEGQFFTGDQTLATVMRVSLEQVEGHYQGACYPFLEDLASGVNRVAFAPDGSMLVGQTDRGWSSIGRRRHGLERVVYRGVAPFEILTMGVTEDGFELTFTEDVDPASCGADAFRLESYTYDYHADYGAPEKDERQEEVTVVVAGPRTVSLTLPEFRRGYVYELAAEGVRAADGRPLLHANAYYTLINVPGEPSFADLEPELPKLLFLTHSAGFEHEVTKRPRPHIYSHAEERLIEAAQGRFEVTATQDCALITRENLEGYDVVVFYTTGELPVPNPADLVDWVRAGGAFVAIHSATDTFYEYAPYQDMLGGVFDGHPWNEEVTLAPLAPGHPAVVPFGTEPFAREDEIYQFRDLRRHSMQVLLALESTATDPQLSRGNRAAGEGAGVDYPLAWCRDHGLGRVFYTALGHGEDAWDDAFLAHVLGGASWAIEGAQAIVSPPPEAWLLYDGLADAVDGPTDLSGWSHLDGSDARWLATEGYFEVAPGTGNLVTRKNLDSGYYHLEFMTPNSPPSVVGQDRGNSGIYLMGRYELQVLDSWGVENPSTGDCGGIYSVAAPAVNASRPPGTWQSFDIQFAAPRSAGDAARVTVWHNGVKIHDDVEIPGPTGGAAYTEGHGPLMLQDHGSGVRYRNAWYVHFW